MSANERRREGDLFVFEQTMAISSYLIAIAAGSLESRELSECCAIWSEPGLIRACAWEFAGTETFLKTAEALCGKYVWGRYDMLILPPSFPFGGMENPCLTFLTPSLLAKDRSLVSVVAHEITHSWTGNLVTNKNWEHFWLNEGFTKFIERKILGQLYGEPHRELLAQIGQADLQRIVDQFGPESNLARLVPDLSQICTPIKFILSSYFLLLLMMHSQLFPMKRAMRSYTTWSSWSVVQPLLILTYAPISKDLQDVAWIAKCGRTSFLTILPGLRLASA